MLGQLYRLDFYELYSFLVDRACSFVLLRILKMENTKVKFIIASEEGMRQLKEVGSQYLHEKYSGILPVATIEAYNKKQFHTDRLIAYLNDFSNQGIMVYVDEIPVGYAFLREEKEKPAALENRKSSCIVDFVIIKEYRDSGVKNVLLQKCLQLCRSYEALWISESENAVAMLQFFKRIGFEKSGTVRTTNFSTEMVDELLICETIPAALLKVSGN